MEISLRSSNQSLARSGRIQQRTYKDFAGDLT